MKNSAEKAANRAQGAKAADAGDGFILVDKPGGKTSADVVNLLKKLPGVYKAGHAGTLDPFATGVLICPVNRATRLSRFFLHGNKKYSAVLRLGIETDTMDRTGQITAERPVHGITPETVSRAAEKFTGRISQVPPAYSALKHNGTPLYKYARDGNPVQKPARSVEITSIRITRVDLPEVGLEVACSGGTYIRKLAADIGTTLGCGAHLSTLVRTESCGFTLDEAVSLTDLRAAGTPKGTSRFVIPMADALRGMPSYTAGEELAEKISFGRPISEADMQAPRKHKEPGSGGFIKVTDTGNRLLAVIEKDKNRSGYSYCCVFQSE
ncbi:MAG: tRNA pseudouridine(55) synthase TruB [Desulfobacterales bacterium]